MFQCDPALHQEWDFVVNNLFILNIFSCVAGVCRGAELWVQDNTFQTAYTEQIAVQEFFLIIFSQFLHCLYFQMLCLVCALLIWPSVTLIIRPNRTRPSYLLISSFCSLDFIMSLFDMWPCLSIILCLLGLSYLSCAPTVEDDPFHFGNDVLLTLFLHRKPRLAQV